MEQHKKYNISLHSYNSFPEGDLYSLIVNSKCLSEEHTRTIFRQLLSAVNVSYKKSNTT